MIRDIGATLTERVSEFRGVRRTVEQPDQDPAPNAVGERGTNPFEDLEIYRRIRGHDDTITVQLPL